MGFPDGYRKAVHMMDLAEQRGWPVLVLVDTPGADPHEFSEEEGQAFAINEVIHKTTALRVPNLAYIISLGASGGAIAVTPTNRTIMNEYATYMVISPGGCASILFRNRSADSIRKAAEGLRLTSADAVQQGTVDDVVEEGLHPGHRYPHELLDRAKEAVVRNLRQILGLRGAEAERVRREKFYAMGEWAESGDERPTDALARLASQQNDAYQRLEKKLAKYIAQQNRKGAENNGKLLDQAALRARIESRLNVAQAIYAIEKWDAEHLCRLLNLDDLLLTRTQWGQIREFALARRYGNMNGAGTLHPHGGSTPYRRLHPVDWICRLADDGSFREFPETVRYCAVVQPGFPGYGDALERGIRHTGLHSGLITGTARVGGHAAVLAINNFGLVGSSLCDEIGEKFRFAAHHALEARLPLISVAMGGGARMQEGTPSMHRNIPKAQHALNELEEAGVPHISIIADPTLGGTAISYGLRGDLMIVVQGSANIGFSGKRVVEQFQQRKVAPDFQHGTWLLHRGFVDEVAATDALARRLAELLEYRAGGGRLTDLRTRQPRGWEPAEEVSLATAAYASGAAAALATSSVDEESA
jgi:acetyl-CoA carboxylase beta subunit